MGGMRLKLRMTSSGTGWNVTEVENNKFWNWVE